MFFALLFEPPSGQEALKHLSLDPTQHAAVSTHQASAIRIINKKELEDRYLIHV